MASMFTWDGSLRDIVIANCKVGDWVKLFATLQHRENFEIGYPSPAQGFWANPEAIFGQYSGQSIWLKRSGIRSKCDIISADSIEFDLDPRQIKGQADLDQLISLMSEMADAVGRTVSLTEEGDHSRVLLAIEPSNRR